MVQSGHSENKCYKTKLSSPEQWAQLVVNDIGSLVRMGVGASPEALASAPASVDLSQRGYMPAVLEQSSIAIGYCWIPYEYVLNPDLASDFHAITLVT